MLSYCLKCREKARLKNLKVAKTDQGKSTPFSKCAVCGSEKRNLLKSKKIVV